MKRMKKAILLPVRYFAYRWRRTRTFYWAERKLSELRNVNVMPYLYYKWLFKVSMSLVEYRITRRLADQAIHTIPYNVRFSVA